DRILWVEGEDTQTYLADIEFQSSGEEDGDERVFLYAALLFRKYRLPVQSVLILLRPEAEVGFTGKTGFVAPGGGSLTFTYQRINDLSGNSRRRRGKRNPERQSGRGAGFTSTDRQQALWSAGCSDLDGYRGNYLPRSVGASGGQTA